VTKDGEDDRSRYEQPVALLRAGRFTMGEEGVGPTVDERVRNTTLGVSVRTRIAIAVLVLSAPVLVAARPATAPPQCYGGPGGIQPIQIEVSEEVTSGPTVATTTATGRYAVPAEPPTGLVVFAHGYGHDSSSWEQHILDLVQRSGVVAVAMDYRGTYTETVGAEQLVRGWRVAEGAADSIAIARTFQQVCGVDTIALFGVSMGGNTGGLAVAAQPTGTDGLPLFDAYFHVEGASNVIETWAGATVLAPANAFAARAAQDIEAQMGGTFLESSGTYLERTVVNRVADIAGAGLQGVYLIHGVEDGLVPYNQAVEFDALLRANGVTTEFVTVGTHGTDSEAGTTITGYGGVDSPLTGHASEASQTHIIMRTAKDRLVSWFAGTVVTCSHGLLDGETFIAVQVPTVC